MTPKIIIKALNQVPFFRDKISLYSLSQLFLSDNGWRLSLKRKMPVDKDGLPLPWFTYPSIYFIGNRLKSSFSVFEFGSGNSTMWFSKRVKEVFSIENDPVWYDELSSNLSKSNNINYSHKTVENQDYQSEILKFTKHFDLIIIDGRFRVQCCLNSLKALKEDGVIVWDNSDRNKYQEGFDFLHKNGFKQIDFEGLGPINSSRWMTSIFYRNNNCLGI